jgi:hypothetical protein
MRRTLPGQFPGVGFMQDTWATSVAGNTSGWTQGATLMAVNTTSSSGIPKGHILSISIYARLFMLQTSTRLYGKLGKIIAGVTLDGPAQSGWGGGYQDFRQPMQLLPADATLLASLWDPALDPLPPGGNGQDVFPYLSLSAIVSPPVPLDIRDQESMGIGIWMTPSLLGPQTLTLSNLATGLYMYGAKYVINYDDGL